MVACHCRLPGADLVKARPDALSIGVGSGGVVALYLAWRRQHSTEADLGNANAPYLNSTKASLTNRPSPPPPKRTKNASLTTPTPMPPPAGAPSCTKFKG